MADLLPLLALLALAVFAWFGAPRLWRRYEAGRVTVFEHEAGLRYVNGRFAGLVGPGRYATWPDPIVIERLDLRSVTTEVAGQEILTADALPVRVTLVVTWRIADPIVYKRAAAVPHQGLYAAAQVALRRRVAAVALDALLADRGLIERDLGLEIERALPEAGLIVSGAALRDLSLTGVAKQAMADLWKAQKEGEAALARARGEQAALRALANAARMLKGNPELMNLRLLQALAAKPGQPAPTVVLGGATGLLPVQPGDPAGPGLGEDP